MLPKNAKLTLWFICKNVNDVWFKKLVLIVLICSDCSTAIRGKLQHVIAILVWKNLGITGHILQKQL